MSADGPSGTGETDKPAPPGPVPAGTGGGADVYDPDLDELADKALSAPPIDYDEDPVPVRAPVVAPDYGPGDGPAPAQGSRDGAAAAEAREPAAGPAARQGTGREAREQPAAPAPGREQDGTEAGTESGESQRRQDDSSGQAAREVPPVPHQDHSVASQDARADAGPPADVIAPGAAVPEAREPAPASGLWAGTESVTEPDNGQDGADTALPAARADDIPATPAASPGGELPGEPEFWPAERPEPPAAPLTTADTVTQEPGTADPDPEENALPEDRLAAVTAGAAAGSDTDPGETTVVPEAEPAQASTAEHDPQTRDPEPEPERALTLAETAAPDTADAVSPDSDAAYQAAPDAESGEDGDASSGGPDKNADAPPWAAALVSAVESLQAQNKELKELISEQDAKNEAKLDAVKAELEAERRAERERERAEHQAETDQLRAEHQEEMAQLKADFEAKLDDVLGQLRAAQQERPEVRDLNDLGNSEPDTGGMDSIDARVDEISIDGNLDKGVPGRRYSDDAKGLMKSMWGLAKSSGVNVPGLDLVLDSEEAREKYQELPEKERNQVLGFLETAGLAYGSLPQDAATVALASYFVVPWIRDRLTDLSHRRRRGD